MRAIASEHPEEVAYDIRENKKDDNLVSMASSHHSTDDEKEKGMNNLLEEQDLGDDNEIQVHASSTQRSQKKRDSSVLKMSLDSFSNQKEKDSASQDLKKVKKNDQVQQDQRKIDLYFRKV